MSKVLVVVYSNTGTSQRVAELLCSQHRWTLGAVTDLRPRRGVEGNLRCVLDSLLRRRPRVRYDGPPPEAFDLVVLVAPIWLMRLAGPMRSFVARSGRALRRVAVLSVMGGQGAPNAAAEIAELCGSTPVLSAAVTQREADDGSCAAMLQSFGAAIEGVLGPAAPVRAAELSTQAV
ncbi:MAG: flavodoxin [Proteobacteria bacterium]|nr:flavodoxin [Pseudomonadota bacterium]